MSKHWWITTFAALVVWPALGHAENLVKEVKQSVAKSTLDQPGTKPFHLKATLGPSFERDKDAGRTGLVEIWWASPTQWKREVRSPEFHQIEVVDSGHDWQKNEGDYFPEWLRETAIELIKPVPPIDQVVEEVKTAEVRRMGPMTNLSWTTATGTAEVRNISRSWIAWQSSNGVLLYAGGFGWGGEFKDYQDFHGKMIARTVNVGSPQVTAKIVTLEDLGEVPAGFFNTTQEGGDPQPLQTVMLDEISLRKNLLPAAPIAWPPLQDGSLEGNFTTDVMVDRKGRVRETGTGVSENSGVNGAGRQAAAAMQFKPFLLNGVPVQAMSQVTIPFKTVRPAGTETFASARTFFERARHADFPASGAGKPYVLRAEFSAKATPETVAKGRYEDTWLSDTQWRREAWFAKSHYVRSRNGDTSYQFAEGPEAPLLRLVFRAMEPIPAMDTFVESDWRMRRDSVDGVQTVRVLSGYESQEGKLDAEHARGYWFDNDGRLVKTYFSGLETHRSDFADFSGVAIARRIDVLTNGSLALQITVIQVDPAGPTQAKACDVPGHTWTRAFTDEAR
jgi:hypothetical protein